MKKIIFLVLLLIPALAFARFEKLVTDIDEMFDKFTGYVVSVEDNTLITDLGRSKGVYEGLELKIYRENEPIIHPITKQVLGNKKIFIGDIQIREVADAYSTAKISKLARSVKPGDIVTMNPPVEVSVQVEKVPVRLEMLLKEELGNARNILMKENAEIVLKFIQEEEGGIRYTVSDKSGGSLIHSKYFSDQDLEQGVGTIATKDILRSAPINKTYKSMAVGHVKPDGKIYIAAATRHEIDIFTFDGKTFVPAGSVDAEFDNIQNIELADLNENGTDELFVTEVKYKTTVSSSILEFQDSGFKVIDSGMLYIFRTVHVKGVKKIVAQKLGVDGSYIGMVHNFIHMNGKYERGRAVSASPDINIYGFGYSDLDNDGTNEVFNINDQYNLSVYNGSAVKYTSVEEFGQTPYYFILENEILDEMALSAKENLRDQGDIDPFMQEKSKKYIKGRVFVNSDNNIYVVQNEQKYKILSTSKTFGASRFAVFSWDGRRLRNMWVSEVFEPTIVDYYMYEEFGRTYLFMLRNASAGLLASDVSQLIYIETK